MTSAKPLHEAILKNDESGIVSLANSRPGLDPLQIGGAIVSYRKMRCDPRGALVTPLLVAVHFGELELCKYLILEDANLNEGKLHGMGPLSLALDYKYYNIAKLLIASGSDVNIVDDEGKTPMYHAIKEDSPVFIIEELLSAGAPKEGETHFRKSKHIIKRTPLACAVLMKNIPILKCLLGLSVDVNSVIDDNLTPLSHAVSNGSYEMAKLLVNAGASVESNESQVHVFYLALKNGNLDIIKLLVEKTPDIDKMINTKFNYVHGKFRFSSNGTLLHMALAFCNFEAAKILIDNGATISIAEPEFHIDPFYGFSAIDPAVLDRKEKDDYKNIIMLLIEKGFDFHTKTEYWNSPLKNFVIFKRWLAIEECIRCGINVNKIVCEDFKLSLFHMLLTTGKRKLIALCLDFGADCTASLGKNTCLNVVVKNNDSYLTRLILKHSQNVLKEDYISSLYKLSSKDIKCIFQNELALKESILKGNAAGVKKALKGGALPAGSIAGTRNPLHWASELKHYEVVEALLAYGSPVNTLDSKSYSTLSYAALAGSENVCKSLLRHGAVFDFPLPAGSLFYKDSAKIYCASGKGRKNIFKLLKSTKKLFKLLKTRSNLVVKKLEVKMGTDYFWCYVNCINKKGCTLLGEALRLGQLEVAKKIMFLKFAASSTLTEQDTV